MDPARKSESMQVDEAVDNLNRIVADAWDKLIKFGAFPRPGPRREATTLVLQLFKAADLPLRARITSRLGRRSKDDLVGHARIMAILAIRRNSPALVLEGLTALAAEAGTGGDRRGTTSFSGSALSFGGEARDGNYDRIRTGRVLGSE